jgi:hypothetical protein
MMAYGPEGGGGEPSISIGFDLDSDDPEAKDYYGNSFGRDYFMANTIPFRLGQQKTLEVVGVSLHHDCNFKLQLLVLDGTSLATETFGYQNKSFSVSGTLSPTRYKVFYGGGIANSCPPSFGWMKLNPADPRC